MKRNYNDTEPTDDFLQQLGKASLDKTSRKVRIAVSDLAQIPWIRKELEMEEKEDSTEDPNDQEALIVNIRKLDESFKLSREMFESNLWKKDLILKALTTKPANATHITFYSV